MFFYTVHLRNATNLLKYSFCRGLLVRETICFSLYTPQLNEALDINESFDLCDAVRA